MDRQLGLPPRRRRSDPCRAPPPPGGRPWWTMLAMVMNGLVFGVLRMALTLAVLHAVVHFADPDGLRDAERGGV